MRCTKGIGNEGEEGNSECRDEAMDADRRRNRLRANNSGRKAL